MRTHISNPMSYECIQNHHIDELNNHGFSVIDGFLGEEHSLGLRNEILSLHQQGELHPNGIRFQLGNRNVDVIKPNILELDLHHHGVRESVPYLNELFWSSNALASRLNALMPALGLNEVSGSHTLKVQLNKGQGGCFPWHYDNPGAPDKRRVSCLLYLNPDWELGHGGEISVSSFLQKSHIIEPRHDRLVMFYSETMLHRVMASNSERVCLTIWLDAAKDDCFAPSWAGVGDKVNTDAFLRQLASPESQRTLSRAVYSEEFTASIRECMALNPKGEKALLEAHNNRVDLLNSKMGSLISSLRELKEPL